MASEKDILIITPSKLRGVRVGERIVERVELDWTPEKLPQALATVRAALGKRIRLVLSDTFTYVSSVPLPETTSPEEERGSAGESFQLLMPEKLSETSWDYRAFELPREASQRPRRLAEVIALTGSCARTIIPAVREAGFRVETAEPESASLARLLQNENGASLLLAKSESAFLIAGVFRGHVLSSFSSFTEITDTAILDAQRFFEYRFACTIPTLHVIGAFQPDDFARVRPDALDQSRLAVSIREGSSAEGMALKKDLEGSDADILSIDLSTLKQSDRNAASPEPSISSELLENTADPKATDHSMPSERFRLHFLTERSEKKLPKQSSSWSSEKKRTLILAGIFVIVLLSGIGVIYAILKNRSSSSPASSSSKGITENTSPSPENVPPESETADISKDAPAEKDSKEKKTGNDSQENPAWNHQSFRIAIENGSGVAGAATALKSALSNQDFLIISVGNADTETTPTITATPSIPDDFLEELKGVLPAGNWTINRKDSLSIADADIIVTLGIEQKSR